MSRSIPKYRRHVNGQAFVQHKSIPTKTHQLYLGKYGTEESRRKYQQFLARLLADDEQNVALTHAFDRTVDELIALYLQFAEEYYSLDGKPSRTLCANKRHLGAMPGILSVFHTWNGELAFHPHVHMLITGGGITNDGEHFEPARGKFLVPVEVLSRKIAAKFRDALKKEKPSLFARIPRVCLAP